MKLKQKKQKKKRTDIEEKWRWE